jgi:DNA invertase Pin-like site-specific DNA recombinase
MTAKKNSKPTMSANGVRIVRHSAGHSQCIGYARVSTLHQNLDVQLQQLKDAACCRIYCEHISGAAKIRPGFQAMLETLRKGDTVTVVALDRLGRRSSELLTTLDAFRDQGVHFRDLRSGVNTQSPHGRVLLSFLVALAEAEREMTRERIREALAHGKTGGRPSVITPAGIALAEKLVAENYSTREIAKAMKLGATTVRKMLSLRPRENPLQKRLFE